MSHASSYYTPAQTRLSGMEQESQQLLQIIKNDSDSVHIPSMETVHLSPYILVQTCVYAQTACYAMGNPAILKGSGRVICIWISFHKQTYRARWSNIYIPAEETCALHSTANIGAMLIAIAVTLNIWLISSSHQLMPPLNTLPP